MRDVNFEGLDLLSLNILVNLYEHKSAKFVSEKLSVPAPKISRCLKNARDIFGDELFVRRKYGLIPNDFAGQVYPIAKKIVECSHGFHVLHDDSASQDKPHFDISVPEIISGTLPQALMSAMKQAEKTFSFNICAWTRNSLRDIVAGGCEFGICCAKSAADISIYGSELEALPLKRLEKLYLICHREHPVLRGELTVETIAEYPLINTHFGTTEHQLNPLQEYCLAEGKSLCTDITISCLSSLFGYIGASEAVALVPYSSVYEMVADRPDLYGCQLSEMETRRIYSKSAVPSLFLVRNRASDSSDHPWMMSQLQTIVGQCVE